MQRPEKRNSSEELQVCRSGCPTTSAHLISSAQPWKMAAAVHQDEQTRDDLFYNRQAYVLGKQGQQQLALSRVFISGAGGVGSEVAKNLVLAGVKQLLLQDYRPVMIEDLGSNGLLREEDVGRNRAEACCHHLAELNSRVSLQHCMSPLDVSGDLSFLLSYHCVILTEAELQVATKINQVCRLQQTASPLPFLMADVYGVFSWLFCDPGCESPQFTPSSSEYQEEICVGHITKGCPGMVWCTSDHNLQTGDTVMFQDVEGMCEVNEGQYHITVISPVEFHVADTSQFSDYKGGGVVKLCQREMARLKYECLDTQLMKPNLVHLDSVKQEATFSSHVGMLVLQDFRSQEGRLPRPHCQADAAKVRAMADSLRAQFTVEELDSMYFRALSCTASGQLPPLVSFIGGLTAQEAIKCVTKQHVPLHQWLHFTACELVDMEDSPSYEPCPLEKSRYSPVSCCIGRRLHQTLASKRIFVVGCSSVGCEVMKLLTVIGCGTCSPGQITLTDEDIVQKANFITQSLLSERHLHMPKTTAVESALKETNRDVRVMSLHHRVCPLTEAATFTDDFWESQDVVVTSVDSYESRRYVDSRCVQTARPLVDAGMVGLKGHIQVILPHQTESYCSQPDPLEKDVPYCTIKSFPSSSEQTIIWAKEKFERLFWMKPCIYNKFWEKYSSVSEVLKLLESGALVEDLAQMAALLKWNLTWDWPACVTLARVKFEKYFNHKAQHLLHCFPLDTRIKDGSLFWNYPKRSPQPLQFQAANPVHIQFVVSFAVLWARVCGVDVPPPATCTATVVKLLQGVTLPQFVPNFSKKIETDETAKTPAGHMRDPRVAEGDQWCMGVLMEWVKRSQASDNLLPLVPPKMYPAVLNLEEDDLLSSHLIEAMSVLRCMMYRLRTPNEATVHRVAGNLVPAVVTTTSCLAGLVTLELLKLVKGCERSDQRNCFMNLMMPTFVFSEPLPAMKMQVTHDITITLWDKWEVHGDPGFTLHDFLMTVQSQFGVMVSMIVQGTKMVYVPIMPGHAKRKTQLMSKLLSYKKGTKYSLLTVGLHARQMDEDDAPGPP